MQKITPCLWFDFNAEDALNFYTSIFHDAKVINRSYYPEGAPGPAGSLLTAILLLEGQEFMVLNGGPHYKFTPAISFYIKCDDQNEIDYYWYKLLENGRADQCGWLTDQFGISWQIVPPLLGEMLTDADSAKSKRVMEAMLKMVKIDIAALKNAYDHE